MAYVLKRYREFPSMIFTPVKLGSALHTGIPRDRHPVSRQRENTLGDADRDAVRSEKSLRFSHRILPKMKNTGS